MLTLTRCPRPIWTASTLYLAAYSRESTLCAGYARLLTWHSAHTIRSRRSRRPRVRSPLECAALSPFDSLLTHVTALRHYRVRRAEGGRVRWRGEPRGRAPGLSAGLPETRREGAAGRRGRHQGLRQRLCQEGRLDRCPPEVPEGTALHTEHTAHTRRRHCGTSTRWSRVRRTRTASR